MALEKISDRVRDLIGENDQRAAAELLVQAFRDKNSQLFNIALVQQANIKKLGDQNSAGILSPDEINREQAKINVALLHLSDEYARLFETTVSDTPRTGMPRWAPLGAAGLALLALLGWLVYNAVSKPDYPDTFDLEVNLHEAEGEHKLVQEGKVNLKLGKFELQTSLPLNSDGKAIFRDLSGSKYRGLPVHLIYFPPRVRKFRIIGQSDSIVSGKDQMIDFTVQFLPDTTKLEATLRDAKGHAISEATITVDGNLRVNSDVNGYFSVTIPKANGTEAYFLVEKNGERLFGQDLAIWSGHKPFPL